MGIFGNIKIKCNMSNWNVKNIEKFKKILEIVNGKKFVNGTDVTSLYNDVFNKNLKPTNCSSCVSQRVKELKTSYDNHLKQKEMALRVIDQLMMEGIIPEGAAVATNMTDEITITTKKGRPKKKE